MLLSVWCCDIGFVAHRFRTIRNHLPNDTASHPRRFISYLKLIRWHFSMWCDTHAHLLLSSSCDSIILQSGVLHILTYIFVWLMCNGLNFWMEFVHVKASPLFYSSSMWCNVMPCICSVIAPVTTFKAWGETYCQAWKLHIEALFPNKWKHYFSITA
jgi:hypothetical protein